MKIWGNHTGWALATLQSTFPMIYRAIYGFPAKIRFLADLAGNRPGIEFLADLGHIVAGNRNKINFLVHKPEGLSKFHIFHDISIFKQEHLFFLLPCTLL